MICKPIAIKAKRSKSSFQNTFYATKTKSKPSKSDLSCIEWENSLVSLNKVLNNLNDDTLKRYNTQTDRYADLNVPTPINEDTKNLKASFLKNTIQNRTSNKFQTLEPEPWFNNNEIRKTQKGSKTNSVLHSSHFSLPKDWQHRNSLQKSLRDSSNRERFSSQIEHDKSQRLQKITKLLEQNQALWTQNFNYTNEQKAKVSIEYLLHEQKHKKMEKILKYKRNLICKPGLQKNKINQHSKYLVDMLKKLSKDYLFASNYVEEKPQKKQRILSRPKANSKKNSQHQTIDYGSKNDAKSEKKFSSSCNLISQTDASAQGMKKKSKPTCSIKEIGADFKSDTEKKQLHSYKMTFKPRKNFIFQKRPTSNSEKNLKQGQMESMRRLSEKHFTMTNHFLNVKKMKK